jgi:hypothetical protein
VSSSRSHARVGWVDGVGWVEADAGAVGLDWVVSAGTAVWVGVEAGTVCVGAGAADTDGASQDWWQSLSHANACPGIARVTAVNEAVATASRQSRDRMREQGMFTAVTAMALDNRDVRKESVKLMYRLGRRRTATG